MDAVTAEQLARLPLAAASGLDRGRLRAGSGVAAEQRVAAARIARLLVPVAERAGGWVSTQLVLVVARGPDTALRPPVAVGLGEPPQDGVCEQPPVLVVDGRDGDDPAGWLALGVAAVWVVDRRGAAVHLPGGRVRRLDPGAALGVPGHPWLTLPVAAACALPSADGAAGKRRPAAATR